MENKKNDAQSSFGNAQSLLVTPTTVTNLTKNNLKDLIPNAKAYGEALSSLGNNKSGISNMSELSSIISKLNKEQTRSILVQNDMMLGLNSLTGEEKKRHQAGLEKLLLTKNLTAEEAKLTAAEIMNTVAKKANKEATEKQNNANLSFKGMLGDIGNTLKGFRAKLLDFAKTPAGMATIITTSITLVTMALDAYKKHIQEIIDKGNELTQQWQEQQKAIQSNGETIKSISSDYEKLAKGVNTQGENISLSTEEYKRYNEIVNQIADMFPKMIVGYTNEGNAILSLKGDVEALTKAYIEQKNAAQDAIMLGAEDKWKAFRTEYADKTEWISGDIQKGPKAQYDLLQQLLQYKDDREKFIAEYKELMSSETTAWAIMAAASEAGFDVAKLKPEDLIDNARNLGQIETKARSLFTTLNAGSASVKPILSTYLDTSFDFQKFDTDVQNSIKTILGGLDYNFFSKDEFKTAADMYIWIDTNVIQPLKDPSKAKEVEDALNTLFDPKLKDKSASEYSQAIQDVIDQINTISPELAKQLPDILVKLGFEVNKVENLKAAIANSLGIDENDPKYQVIVDLSYNLKTDELANMQRYIAEVTDTTEAEKRLNSLSKIFTPDNEKFLQNVRFIQMLF